MSDKTDKAATNCARCNAPIDPPDEITLAMLERDFPGFTTDDCAAVCEDCYNELMPEINKIMGSKSLN